MRLCFQVEPIMLWQYLLPATLSVVGKKVKLDVGSHSVPAIVWTSVIGESGIGRSRAQTLILEPLQELQDKEDLRYQLQLKEYKKALQSSQKADSLEPDDDISLVEEDSEPSPPIHRQWFFDVARIQSVMKRLSSQGDNGTLWVRDEMPGLFKTLGQFSSRGDSEALECLLSLWDGNGAKVDRITETDSYRMIKSCLNLTWGIQPEVFTKIFKDPATTQGLQARFLYAAPQIIPQKRVKGKPLLPSILLDLYRWLDNIPSCLMTLSEEADSYYTDLVDDIANTVSDYSSPAIRAWMRKLSGQTLRVAMGLHFLECFCSPSKNLWTLEKSTLEKAATLCSYYRSTFNTIQTKLVEKHDLEQILLKIWELAIKRDVTVRDCYRNIKAIPREAKLAGLTTHAYTLQLLDLLQKDGKGVIQVVGKTAKFRASVNNQEG